MAMFLRFHCTVLYPLSNVNLTVHFPCRMLATSLMTSSGPYNLEGLCLFVGFVCHWIIMKADGRRQHALYHGALFNGVYQFVEKCSMYSVFHIASLFHSTYSYGALTRIVDKRVLPEILT